MGITRPIEERLLEKTSKDSDGCWRFTGCIHSVGYGSILYKGMSQKAHRVAWEIFVGPIPQGMWVLHKCDVRNCINPEHLFLGSRQDNIDDMFAKGRQPNRNGIYNGRSILSEAQIVEILELLDDCQLTQREIGERYGIAQTMVSYIKRAGWSKLKEKIANEHI